MSIPTRSEAFDYGALSRGRVVSGEKERLAWIPDVDVIEAKMPCLSHRARSGSTQIPDIKIQGIPDSRREAMGMKALKLVVFFNGIQSPVLLVR